MRKCITPICNTMGVTIGILVCDIYSLGVQFVPRHPAGKHPGLGYLGTVEGTPDIPA